MHVCIQPQARYRVEEDATAIAPRKTCAAHDGRLDGKKVGNPGAPVAPHDSSYLARGVNREGEDRAVHRIRVKCTVDTRDVVWHVDRRTARASGHGTRGRPSWSRGRREPRGVARKHRWTRLVSQGGAEAQPLAEDESTRAQGSSKPLDEKGGGDSHQDERCSHRDRRTRDGNRAVRDRRESQGAVKSQSIRVTDGVHLEQNPA